MKGGLANQLLGKTVKPKPEFGSPSVPDTMNWRTWSGMSPDLSGCYHAEIDAAWVDGDGNVKIAVHDPFGTTKEMWFAHVNLKTD